MANISHSYAFCCVSHLFLPIQLFRLPFLCVIMIITIVILAGSVGCSVDDAATKERRANPTRGGYSLFLLPFFYFYFIVIGYRDVHLLFEDF